MTLHVVIEKDESGYYVVEVPALPVEDLQKLTMIIVAFSTTLRCFAPPFRMSYRNISVDQSNL
jgi:hypothetical protein